tara:strand:+ start:1195 stop:2163 length:969 start_codon:yes stop_codon:yes gene_type:complete
MAVFKQFNSQDVIVSPLEVNKSFTFLGFTAGNLNFLSSTTNFVTNNTAFTSSAGQVLTGNVGEKEFKMLVAHSVKQLYYSNYLSGSGGQISNASTASFNPDLTITGPVYQTSFYNYEQNSINPQKKLFQTGGGGTIGVISIPSKFYGDYIQPNSFKIMTTGSSTGAYIDDGNGRINKEGSGNTVFGQIIYQHGLVILLKNDSGEFNQIAAGNATSSFSSSYELFETQYKCTIREEEFNYSLNPSIITGSNIPTKFSGSNINYENTASLGKPLDFATGSYFSPYVTTVGLYNNDYELLAVGKLAQPLPTSRTTDTSILINMDR